MDGIELLVFFTTISTNNFKKRQVGVEHVTNNFNKQFQTKTGWCRTPCGWIDFPRIG